MENQNINLDLFGCPKDGKAVFMTGSGTASMESCVMNLFTKNDKVLFVKWRKFWPPICANLSNSFNSL